MYGFLLFLILLEMLATVEKGVPIDRLIAFSILNVSLCSPLHATPFKQ